MRKSRLLALAVAIILVGGGGTYAYAKLKHGRNTLPSQYFVARYITNPSKHFDHVVIILEENKPVGNIIGNLEAPYINKLAKDYSQAAKYYAVTNPSLPNYLALTSASNGGITNDCNPPSNSCQANVKNIGDRLEMFNKTWKSYAEDMPEACTITNSGQYAVKHNPFLYYPDIYTNKQRCQEHVVPFGNLSADLTSTDSLPNFAFIIPNLCNDMHDCAIGQGDAWLKLHVPQILNSPAFTQQNSLLVILWDEGNSMNNNVPVIFAGPAAKRGYVSRNYYSHYSLLKTIENNWQLPTLSQNDSRAYSMSDMLQ